MSQKQLSLHLQSYFHQLKNKKGEEYKGGSIRTALGSLSAFIKENTKLEVDLDKDTSLFKIIDAKLKNLAKTGKDEISSATPLTPEQESQLIDSFDTNTPMGLLSYVYYWLSKYAASRGGHPYTLEFKEVQAYRLDGSEYFKIVIPIEKNNQRGLRAGMSRECIIPPSSPSIPYLKKYLLKRPEDACPYFYLGIQTSKMIKKGVWYKTSRIGKHTIEAIIKNGASKLNFPPGKYVPHSIRATTTTQLYDMNVDNKSVMSITGHRSEAGLRSYQTVTDVRKEDLAIQIGENGVKQTRTLGVKRTFSVTRTSSITRPETSIFKNCKVKLDPKQVPPNALFDECEIDMTC